jgi:hypothetical protein
VQPKTALNFGRNYFETIQTFLIIQKQKDKRLKHCPISVFERFGKILQRSNTVTQKTFGLRAPKFTNTQTLVKGCTKNHINEYFRERRESGKWETEGKSEEEWEERERDQNTVPRYSAYVQSRQPR